MLAVGIGATTAIFSLFHQLLIRPLPVPEPERLVNISLAASDGDGLSHPLFRDLEADSSGLAGIASKRCSR